jgi:outer membrane receptor protein involved in Fe transport
MEASGAAMFLNGLRPAQTPNFAGSLSAGWDKNGKSAELALHRIGGQYEDDLNTHLLRAATTLDASAAWPLGRGWQVVARAENITNALVMAAFNGDGSIERATPRTLWIGVRLH